MAWNDWPGENEADPLEPLLHSAEWPKADRQRIARLEERWHVVSAARKRNRRIVYVAAAVALAASVAVAAVAYWQVRQPGTQPDGTVPVTVRPRGPAPIPRPSPNEDPIDTAVTKAATRATSVSSVSRPATELEELIVRRRMATSRPVGPMVRKGELERRIGPMPRNPSADPGRLAQAIEADRDRLQKQVARWIEPLRGPYHEAAMRAFREQEPGIREAVSFQLLRDNDPRSLQACLRFVERGGPLAAAALAAAGRVPNPPVDRLMAGLNSPRVADRMSAAKILGRIDDPRISQWLIHLASQGTPREEVLTALMCRSDETARDYLAQASNNPIFYGSMLAASRRLETTPSL